MRRALALLLAALSLTACNAAISERPLFSEQDAQGAATLRPGLWAMIENTGAPCPFDAAHPPDPWPGCAKPMMVTERTIGDLSQGEKVASYVLSRGRPGILQVQLTDEGIRDEPVYAYLAVQPVAGGGRDPVTEFTGWLVQCGPPGGGEGHSTGLTAHPLPGMTIRGHACYAASARAIRSAAIPSRDWDHTIRVVWVSATGNQAGP